jgi:hypothetical protein
MDPIVGNSTNINNHHSGVTRERLPTDIDLPSEPVVSDSLNSIIDLSSLTSDAKNAGDEIRGDVISRAEKLLSDPNWLNDSNLDSLADRILSVEDI